MFTLLFVIAVILLGLVILYYAALGMLVLVAFCIQGYQLATGKISMKEINDGAAQFKKNRVEKKSRKKSRNILRQIFCTPLTWAERAGSTIHYDN